MLQYIFTQMAGLDLGGKDAGPLVSRLDTYYEDPDLVKGKVSMTNSSLQNKYVQGGQGCR